MAGEKKEGRRIKVKERTSEKERKKNTEKEQTAAALFLSCFPCFRPVAAQMMTCFPLTGTRCMFKILTFVYKNRQFRSSVSSAEVLLRLRKVLPKILTSI